MVRHILKLLSLYVFFVVHAVGLQIFHMSHYSYANVRRDCSFGIEAQPNSLQCFAELLFQAICQNLVLLQNVDLAVLQDLLIMKLNV